MRLLLPSEKEANPIEDDPQEGVREIGPFLKLHLKSTQLLEFLGHESKSFGDHGNSLLGAYSWCLILNKGPNIVGKALVFGQAHPLAN